MVYRAWASLAERFWSKVERGEGCWLWTASTAKNGYGQFTHRIDGRWRPTTAHRVAYELEVGPIPEGFEVDHLCRVRTCVRPDHLEAVTKTENLARQARTMPRNEAGVFVKRSGFRQW